MVFSWGIKIYYASLRIKTCALIYIENRNPCKVSKSITSHEWNDYKFGAVLCSSKEGIKFQVSPDKIWWIPSLLYIGKKSNFALHKTLPMHTQWTWEIKRENDLVNYIKSAVIFLTGMTWLTWHGKYYQNLQTSYTTRQFLRFRRRTLKLCNFTAISSFNW